MSLIALVSAKGSPGVTTLSLALAHVWPGRILLADCDPAGGDVTSGYLAGDVDPALGLLQLTADARRTDLSTALTSNLIALDGAGDRTLLPGLSQQSHAAALAPWWDQLGTVFTELGNIDGSPNRPVDVLADCGRLGVAHPPTGILRHAAVIVLVLRPTLRSVAHATAALPSIQQQSSLQRVASRLMAVVVGAGPYPAREVTRAVNLPVRAVPDDPRAAAVFSDGTPAGRRFATSALLRAARSLADDLARRDREATGPAPQAPKWVSLETPLSTPGRSS